MQAAAVGAWKICSELRRRGGADPPAVSTIHQVLRRAPLIGNQPRRRQPAMRRFERPVPNDLWQIDATMVTMTGGLRAGVIDVIDDHARYAIARACLHATTTVAWEAMEQAIAGHGPPRQVISDNGLAFTGNRHHRQVLFERRLKAPGIQALTSRPAHPQTCGKLERYHQTFKNWYADYGPPPTSPTCSRCSMRSAGATTASGRPGPSATPPRRDLPGHPPDLAPGQPGR